MFKQYMLTWEWRKWKKSFDKCSVVLHLGSELERWVLSPSLLLSLSPLHLL